MMETGSFSCLKCALFRQASSQGSVPNWVSAVVQAAQEIFILSTSGKSNIFILIYLYRK